MPFALQVLELALVAGALGVDATAAFQVMASRPLVAGGVAGLVLGDLGSGLATGSLVELLWMGGVPVGSVVPPDGTLAAFFAASASVLLPRWVPGVDPLAAASLGILAAVPVGTLGAKAEIVQRRLCDRLCRSAEAGVALGRRHQVALALLGGLTLAFGRSFAAAALVTGAGIPALALLVSHLPLEALRALHWGYWLAWLLGLSVAADYFWERRSLKYLGVMLVGVGLIGAEAAVSRVQLFAVVLSAALLGGLWQWRHAWLESQEDQA